MVIVRMMVGVTFRHPRSCSVRVPGTSETTLEFHGDQNDSRRVLPRPLPLSRKRRSEGVRSVLKSRKVLTRIPENLLCRLPKTLDRDCYTF